MVIIKEGKVNINELISLNIGLTILANLSVNEYNLINSTLIFFSSEVI